MAGAGIQSAHLSRQPSAPSPIATRIIVNNWVEGRDLEPGQRVQGFTHPAWFLVLSAAHALTHKIYYTAIALSVCVAGVGLWLAATRLAHDVWNALAVLLALSFSRAFVDYSTSGLENTLSHLLLFSGMIGLLCVTSRRVLHAPWLDLILRCWC